LGFFQLVRDALNCVEEFRILRQLGQARELEREEPIPAKDVPAEATCRFSFPPTLHLHQFTGILFGVSNAA
jgi:hypothetical protein